MRIVRPCAVASPATAQKTRPTSTSARRILKRDLRQLAITHLCLEELELLVAHRRGSKIRRKRRDSGVEVAHDGIVVAPRILDGVFYSSELCLKIAESAGCLELRIRF